MRQQINLYNPAFIPPREWLTGQSVALATVIVLLVLLMWGGALHWQLSEQQNRLTTVQQELALAQQTVETLRQAQATRVPNPALTAKIMQARTELALRDRILGIADTVLARPGGGYAETLRALSRQSVPGIWITGMRIDEAGTRIELSGRALEKGLLPDYLQRLRQEPSFTGKAFGGLRIDTVFLDTPVGAEHPANAAPPAPTLVRAEGGPVRKVLAFQFSAVAGSEGVESKVAAEAKR